MQGDRERALDFLARLQRRVEIKGIKWDQLPRFTDIDTPPTCFLYRARGDAALALGMWHSWLASAADTDDIPYRYDQPGDPNFCHDCTSKFRGEARRADACQFRVRFESRKFLGERDVVGVSRSPEVPPAGNYESMDGLVVPREAMPQEIQDYLAELDRRTS